MSEYDVIIIGAGAAGLMCALEAGRRGRSVLLLERNDRVGAKIRISGGGRCNFTNRTVEADHFISTNPHFAKSALSRYPPNEIIALLDKHRLGYHEKKPGQLFCNERAPAVIKMLVDECQAGGVRILLNAGVREIQPGKRFAVLTRNQEYTSSAVVVATGGLSVPKLGATDFGYRLARRFGLNIVTPRPGLVPLTVRGSLLRFCRQLSGVSFEARVRTGRIEFQDDLLFTHRGLSGPAILQISSYWVAGEPMHIDLLPTRNILDVLKDARTRRSGMHTLLGAFLPERFARAWVELQGGSKPITQYTMTELGNIARRLHQWEIIPAGTEGFAKAEVTVGGVDTDELSSRTMESKKVSGLYFVGEVVDVTGWLGGFNFQWAWASGSAAGRAV
ncbi:MAG: NAD(P)/FAD-dependent oxidoreductase [Ignavibacteria bacterium]|nr:NAD(P)/FAD-dependent oxidoreductase [Ignavibacteria bacterium]